MKTDKITVNKTEENPAGVELEIIKPQTSLEQRLLSHLLVAYIRDAKKKGNLPYDMPENFGVEYLREGTFLASAQGPRSASGYYEPAKPIAIFGLRTRGRTFDLIHAEATRRAASHTDSKTQTETRDAAPGDEGTSEEAAVGSENADA